MSIHRLINAILSLILAVSLLLGSNPKEITELNKSPAAVEAAVPIIPTDETKVPHYFGPNPNWANSPFTLQDVTVTITGDGTGATASATVGANGAITGITITNPGSGYTAANVSFPGIPASMTIDGAGLTQGVLNFAADVGATAEIYNVHVGSATGGTFTLSVDGMTTAAIAWNATAAALDDALKVSGAKVKTVSGSGSIADPWVIEFNKAPTTVTMDATGLTQGVADIALTGTAPTYSLHVGSATGGTFTLAVGGPPTAPIAWNATAAVLEAALNALPNIAATVTGSGTISVPWSITFSGSVGSGAAATATVTLSGIVTAIKVDTPGAGYTAPSVTISGGGATTQATATAYGGVDDVSITNPGAGYTMPVVDFDFPDDPNGTIAKAHVICLETDCIPVPPATTVTIADVVVDDPGSGYASAPNVVIRDGPIYAPVNNRLLNAGYAAREKVTKDKKAGPLSAAEAAAVGTAVTTNATATATLKILSVTVDTFGAGYTSVPSVDITDPSLLVTKATATATVNAGGVTQINLTANGSGYITSGGIKKFTDPLPDLCDPATAGCTAEKYIPLGVPEAIKYPLGDLNGIEADQYEIGLVQYRTSFSSSLPDTLVRGYVQLESPSWLLANPGVSQHFALYNEMLDGTKAYVGCESDPNPTTPGCATQRYGVTPPQWLGPTLVTTKNKPVRIIFRNLLPKDSGGNLFMPVDTTLMGSGMGPTGMWAPAEDGTVLDEVRNPLCTNEIDPITGLPYTTGKLEMCFKDNRATLHLHGGISPWISDGTPHQWITPANETTPWPQGVSVGNVPDMAAAGCDAADDGCMTFYYTNQQSARLQFYHDHSYGITRLNVLAGGAAGYVISDETEQALINSGKIPGAADTKLLVIQDRTFVPQDTQLYNQYDADGNVISYGQDPTWDASLWGGYGNTWYHHVYMPAQNPGDPGGMSAYGRWMYGPWFWPPAANTMYGPIPNPYYNKDPKGQDGLRGTTDDWGIDLAVPCNLDDPTTWQYDTDPFCEPELIPGTPNISVGMEQFNDTPIVNGVAYPTITLEPKTYRFRMLNAANDRFFNFQWYVGDPSTASTSLNNLPVPEIIGATEVALKAAELAAAQLDPNIFPTPDTTVSLPGPDWIMIGSEGGFLPAPAVIDGQQFTTWITDPTRFDVGNVDLHSLLLAPAERADVIVDFSKFAGKTLILYNDGPAAFPARVASYDYYTGAPDLSPVGAPTILPGYGPNTRTVMQVKIVGTPQPAFNLTTLRNAFSHKADGSGVFESGQHPIIVGQAAYNSAYGSSFGSGDCSAAVSGATKTCDGFVRVSDTTSFNFNTLEAQSTVMNMRLEPKAIHDEMNATTFDDYGRMQATLGMEAQPPSPGVQNATLYPFVNPQTELIDATNLPKNVVIYDSVTGLPVSDVKVTPISSATDGTQIWRITHNGVDTHPIHFHLFDVQTLNRVTWDNIILPPEPSELGWKETLRVSPLEDTIVALRPVIPQLPWELPNAIRNLNPAMPTGATAVFNNVDPQGLPTAPIVNQLVNFGWEYVYHCHILSHEEMDMMRPVSAAMPPNKPDGLTFDPNTGTLTWNDNSINETAFRVERSVDGGTTWESFTGWTISSPLDQPNIHEVRTLTDTTFDPNVPTLYRVVALNTIGYLDGTDPLVPGFQELTVQSVSEPLGATSEPGVLLLTAAYQAGPPMQIVLYWTDWATEAGYDVWRSADGVNFIKITPTSLPANTTTFTDVLVDVDTRYSYRVDAVDGVGATLASSNVAAVTTPPTAPSIGTATYQDRLKAVVTWTDTSTYEDGFVIMRIEGDITTKVATVPAGTITYTDATLAFDGAYVYMVYAYNASGNSDWSAASGEVFAPPLAPVQLTAVYDSGVRLTWTDRSLAETGFSVQRCAGPGCTNFTEIAALGPLDTGTGVGNVTYLDADVMPLGIYTYRVAAVTDLNPGVLLLSDFSGSVTITLPNFPAAPTIGTITSANRKITVTWTLVPNVSGYTIQWSTDMNFATIAGTGSAKATATTFTSPNLTRGTTYYFRIRANSATNGSSLWANYPPFTLP